jgi:hypothetical protein
MGGEKNDDQKDKEDCQGNLQMPLFLRVGASGGIFKK